ncbi:biotin--[acetyl-CoA-carboxylase] ligase [Helicobacter anatolicus]|uniref:biotin--[acetyl-CoA-carboxylase] ligase n=1 Tax=Helicobacter anatolicus TaxID=2905874 RepID=UPI001E291B1A|nr:biotin--[acetyl-CoA-carboxylase] ligase [Helicobacter anatolicus]MCE3037841.1 biotin--[acetyl-CoA-carboxylase] ligase [Helicobacter anatolicus]
MEIIFYDCLESTQSFLLNVLKNNLCVVALRQTKGIGSRGNQWDTVESGLYFSFCVEKKQLPCDLKIQSASIFFGFIFKEVLYEAGFDVWLKWPNDIYLKDAKIGGVLVNVKQDKVVCGIGLNFLSQSFGCLGEELERKEFLSLFFEKLKNTQEWKQIFSKYKIEFYKNLNFSFHDQDKVISLKKAFLLDDGSIDLCGKIIYSLR